ncbi:MAG: ATP-binding cassette domain-containing protein [Bacteroidota bacterium]|nr:ATP-binding cassette domain-containing protein [Bacteroidota bacterium]
MIEILSLKHKYSNSQRIEFNDFKFKNGEHALITGSSGSGKTTLLHIVAGLLKPESGEVTMQSINLYKLNSRKLDSFRGKNIGIVFQKRHLIKSLTVIENVISAMYFSGKKPDSEIALNLLKELNIEEIKDKKPFELSQGQAQRVAVARAVINQPALILADEPTSSLDDENSVLVINLLKKAALKINAVLLVTSHDNRLKPSFEKIIHLKS